jgi:SnoaL-like protein
VRNLDRAFIAAVVASITAGCARPAAAPPSQLTDAWASAIRDSAATALQAIRRHSEAAQWDSLAVMYSETPGFRFVENGTVRYRSAAAIRQALSSVPIGTRIQTQYRDTEIAALAPGLADVATLFETSFIDPGGARFSFQGAVTLILAHEPGGWRIIRGHSSSPPPPPSVPPNAPPGKRG